MNPGSGGRASLCDKNAQSSVTALTTGPSVRPASKAGVHEQESVEIRARVRNPKEVEKKTMNPEDGAQPVPNYMKPCVSLDVHKGSITATRMDPGGKVVKTWTLSTTRTDIVTLAQGIAGGTPVILETST